MRRVLILNMVDGCRLCFWHIIEVLTSIQYLQALQVKSNISSFLALYIMKMRQRSYFIDYILYDK